VPKSSIAMRTPSAFSCRSVTNARPRSRISAVSVISSSSRCGFKPVWNRTSCTSCGKLELCNCTAETLTATVRGCVHVIASRHAVLRTHSPICRMAPFSSATGMKTSGGTSPRCGWRQRISASNPMTSPVLDGRLRLIDEPEFVARERKTNISLHHPTILRLDPHRRLEQSIDPAPFRLRSIQRRIGMIHQSFAIVAVLGIGRHADARRDRGQGRRPPVVALQSLEHRIRQPTGRRTREVRRDYGELVAAQPGQNLTRLQNRCHSLGEPLEHGVARRMAELVIDLLEPIEIETEHHKPAAAALCASISRSSFTLKVCRLGKPVSESWCARK